MIRLWAGEAVVNTTQSFADEFIRVNAEFHYEAGLSPKIVRTSTGKCCDWCAKLAGTYEYEDAYENGVFRRHDYCRCVVDFYSKKGGRETVHTGTEGKRKYVRSKASGKYYLTDEADQARRITHRKEMEATAKERAKAAREKRIATWAKKRVNSMDDSPLRHPVNPETGSRYRYSPITISDKQFGKKAGKHAHEFGLNAKIPEDRAKMLEIIADITENADERCYGEWLGQESPVLFHIKGDDVVIESKYGDFISILKGGASNERVKRARKR